MTTGPRRSLALAIVVAFVSSAIAALSPRARGASSVEPVRIELSAHDGCPNSSGFYDEIRARTPRVRRAATGEPARSLEVSIVRVSGQSVGEITIRAVDGTTSSRSVSGATCDEVVDALAFIAAVSIDPSASIAPGAASTSRPPLPTLPSASASASASESTSTSASAPPPPLPSASSAPAAATLLPPLASTAPSASSARPVASAPTTRDRTRFSAGFGLALLGTQSPASVLATPVHVELALDRASIFAPSLRLAFSRRSGGLITSDVGRARFRWTVAELDGCPLRVRLTSIFFLRPCVGVEVGALAASGEAIAHAHDVSRAWVAARVLARFELLLLDTLTLDLQVGGALPFTRDTFSFDPSAPTATDVYRAPAIVPVLALDLGVLFS